MSFVSKLKPIQVAGIVLSLAAAYYYFSLEEEDKSVVKNGVVKGESKSPALEKTDVQQKTDLGVPKAGEGTELLEDYGKGLWMLAKRIDETGYGAGYVDMYGTPIYLLTDAEMIRKTLSHTVQHALWGGLDAASKAFFGKNVLFVLEGKQWKFLRSVIKHSFSKQDVTLMDMDLAKMAHRFADRIAPNQEVDMNRIFGLYHLSSVGKSAFDFDLDCLSDSNLGPTTVSDSFEFFIDELPRRSLNPDQSVLGDYTIDNEDNRKWNGAARLLRETIYKVIDARLEEYEIDFHKKSVITVDVGGKAHKKGARKDLLDGMIFSTIEAFDAERNGSEGEVDFGNSDHKKVKVDKQFMDDIIESITDNLVEIMFAGYNTNVGTMANCLHFLALYPDVMKKCQAEVDRFFANNSLGKDFDFEDFSKCYKIEKFPNLNNVFNETLRLRPPAPLIARLLTKDYEGTAPNGKTVRLKSGNALWVPVEYVQQSKDNWYEHDPDKFIPDRFNLKKPFKSGSFIPFSFGPRDCIGKNFAAQEAVLGLIFLIRKFNFEVGKGYVYENFFNGFGYRPYDGSTKKVCSRLIPKTRKQVATPAVH